MFKMCFYSFLQIIFTLWTEFEKKNAKEENIKDKFIDVPSENQWTMHSLKLSFVIKTNLQKKRIFFSVAQMLEQWMAARNVYMQITLLLRSTSCVQAIKHFIKFENSFCCTRTFISFYSKMLNISEIL